MRARVRVRVRVVVRARIRVRVRVRVRVRGIPFVVAQLRSYLLVEDRHQVVVILHARLAHGQCRDQQFALAAEHALGALGSTMGGTIS